jgi:hypothetical protein
MGNIAQNIERNARRPHGMHEYKDPSSLTYESHSILLSVIQCYPIIQSPLGFIALNTNILNGPSYTPHKFSMGVWGAPRFDGVTGKKSTCYHVIIDISL